MALRKPLVIVDGSKVQLPAGDTLGVEAHKTSHQDGGSDELSVQGLNGVLADPQVAGSLATTTSPVVISGSAAPAKGSIPIADSATQATWRNPVVDPLLANVTLSGTAETVIAGLKVPIPANAMSIGHTVRWFFVITQNNYSATNGTLTIKIRYGTTGTATDTQVAQLLFAAGGSNTAPQIVQMMITVRGPLGAGCAAIANAWAIKSAASGIGSALNTAVATPTMSTFTAAPTVANFWTVTIAHGNTTNSFNLVQTFIEIVDW